MNSFDLQAKAIKKLQDDFEKKISEAIDAVVNHGLMPDPRTLAPLEKQIFDEEFLDNIGDGPLVNELYKAWGRTQRKVDDSRKQRLAIEQSAPPPKPTAGEHSQTEQAVGAAGPPTNECEHALSMLTQAELETLKLIVDGLRQAQIAEHLMVTPAAVKYRKRQIAYKLNLDGDAKEEGLRRKGIELGLKPRAETHLSRGDK